MGTGAARICSVCRKDRATTRAGVIKEHRRWNGIMMVRCEGSLKRPVAVVLRRQ
jgi:hypothetical protein